MNHSAAIWKFVANHSERGGAFPEYGRQVGYDTYSLCAGLIIITIIIFMHMQFLHKKYTTNKTVNNTYHDGEATNDTVQC